MSVEVEIKGETIKDVQNAIARFTKLVKKAGILQEVWNRQEFVKPSKKRKLKQERAAATRALQVRLDVKRNRNLNTK